jgi:glutamate N-acetyltransferase/amino-acid N-acetyltransferase
MTTDTKMKTSCRQVKATDHWISGIAKGSGMIGPNMATMLGAIMTDASLSPESAQTLLSKFVDGSFNSINVDGHTSTNDTVVLLASGKGAPLAGDELEAFGEQLQEVCIELAKQIVQDGEGATHVVEINVAGANTDADARTIAEAIANSPLVKTAFAGNDPNWGRIVSAAGYAGPTLDVTKTKLLLNGHLLFEAGAPSPFDAEAVSAQMKANRDVLVELTVGAGSGSARFWTCDLTHEYVTINAEYHT